MKIDRLRLSDGRIVEGEELARILDKVATDYETNALAIRREDPYASHVTEEHKDKLLTEELDYAENVRQGESVDFTTWQRVNYLLTGESVAFLTKKG